MSGVGELRNGGLASIGDDVVGKWPAIESG